MRIICDLRDEQIKKISQLIEKGRFTDIDSFMQVSVDNQLKLESEEKADWSLMIKEFNSRKTKTEKVENKYEELKVIQNKNLIPVDSPGFNAINTFEAETEADLWIWGQINKILPIKFISRLLFNKIPNGEKYISLKDFTEETCILAEKYGHFLMKKDLTKGKKRDERLSAAFPIGKKREKAFSRFSSHFIGQKRTDSLLSGALVNLKFANIKGGYGEELIGISRPGIEFSKIENPVIDNRSFDRSLNEEEVRFYLDHVNNNVLGEAKSMRIVLKFLANGIKNREEINSELKKKVPKRWSDKVINTQRAGLMARMYELGLINKKKKGIYVEYLISDRGKYFLDLT